MRVIQYTDPSLPNFIWHSLALTFMWWVTPYSSHLHKWTSFHYLYILVFILFPLDVKCKWPWPQDTSCLEGLQWGYGWVEDQKRVVRRKINILSFITDMLIYGGRDILSAIKQKFYQMEVLRSTPPMKTNVASELG